MENIMFHGSIIAWLILIPFIILIVLNNKFHGLEILYTNYVDIKEP
jgi:hypothetical protein